MNNKYVNRSKISEAKFRELVRLFSMDLTASQIAEISGLNRNTVNRYLKGIRKRIAEYCLVTEPPGFTNNVKKTNPEPERRMVGLSGSRREIYADLLRPAEIDKILSNIDEKQEKTYLASLVKSRFDLVIDPSSRRRIYLCAENIRHTEATKFRRMEGFWGFAKSRLEKFKGLHSSTYLLHLKESEFRYNQDKDSLYKLILKIIRNKPLF